MKEFADPAALQKITARAAHDRIFRQQLLRDPRAAVQEAIGTPIPESLRLKFIEKGPDVDLLIVLPDLVAEDGELSEEDVASVAGGTDWGCQDGETV